MFRRRIFWTILGACMLGMIVACGGSSDTPSATSTPRPSPAALTREEAEQQAGFTLLVPSDVPAKVNPTPQYTVLARNHGVDIRYTATGDSHDPESPNFGVHEQKSGTLALNGSPISNETIGGTTVEFTEFDTGDVQGTPATITGVWSQGELKVSATFVWGSKTDLVEITPEMSTLARRLVASIISPQSSP